MLQLFTMLFPLPHHRPPRNWEPPFQAICVWVSTFEFLLCLTTSIIMLQVASLNLGRNPKQSISLLSTVFFTDSQFCRHFFRLHLLCRILLPTFSLVKRNIVLMDSAASTYILKTSLEMDFFTEQPPWELPPPSLTITISYSSFNHHFFTASPSFLTGIFPNSNSLILSTCIIQIKICMHLSMLRIFTFYFFCFFWWPLMTSFMG